MVRSDQRLSSNIFFRRVGSEQSHCFAFNEAIFNAWWVAQGKVCVLEGLCWLAVSVDVRDGVSCESFPLNTVVSRKVVLFSDILAVNLIVGWNLLAWAIKCSTCFTSQSDSHVNSITVSVRDQDGELFDFNAFTLEFVLEIN